MKKTSKIVPLLKNENDIKNEDNLKNEDYLKNEDDLKTEDDLKNEDHLRNDDNLKNKDNTNNLNNKDNLNTEDNLTNENNLKNEDNMILKVVAFPSLQNLSCSCYHLKSNKVVPGPLTGHILAAEAGWRSWCEGQIKSELENFEKNPNT